MNRKVCNWIVSAAGKEGIVWMQRGQQLQQNNIETQHISISTLSRANVRQRCEQQEEASNIILMQIIVLDKLIYMSIAHQAYQSSQTLEQLKSLFANNSALMHRILKLKKDNHLLFIQELQLELQEKRLSSKSEMDLREEKRMFQHLEQVQLSKNFKSDWDSQLNKQLDRFEKTAHKKIKFLSRQLEMGQKMIKEQESRKRKFMQLNRQLDFKHQSFLNQLKTNEIISAQILHLNKINQTKAVELGQLGQRVQLQQKQIKTLEDAITDRKLQMKTLKQAVQKQRKSISQIEKELAQQTGSARDKIQAEFRQIDLCLKKLHGQNQQLRSILSNSSEPDADWLSLEEESKRLKTQNQQLAKENSGLLERYHFLKSEESKLSAECQIIKNFGGGRRQGRENSGRRKEGLEQKLRESKKVVQNLKRQLTSIRK